MSGSVHQNALEICEVFINLAHGHDLKWSMASLLTTYDAMLSIIQEQDLHKYQD